MESFNFPKVTLKIEESIFDNTYKKYICPSCFKSFCLNDNSKNFILRITKDSVYCNFCIKNFLYTERRDNVLFFSFKSIIGYYFYYIINQRHPTCKKIYFSELKDIITNHALVGNGHPLFNYDKDSLNWFIDFNYIKKSDLNDIFVMISLILDQFNLEDIFNKEIKIKNYLCRFEEAILEFSKYKKRPDGKIILCPTLFGCINYIHQKDINWEHTKNINGYIFN